MNRLVKALLQKGYKRLSDRFCKPPVVFHHIPKCGGSSLSWALRRSYVINHININVDARIKAGELSAIYHNLNPYDQINASNEMLLLYLLENGFACITGHIRTSKIALHEYAKTHKFVSLVRNPFDRLYSHFVWRARVNRLSEANNFFEFFNSEESYGIRNMFLSYFSGFDARGVAKGHAIDQARRNIDRFHYIGHLEEISRVQKDLRTLLGRKIHIGQRNVTPSHHTKDKSDILLHRDVIEKACEADLAVYRHIIERFPLERTAPPFSLSESSSRSY